MQKEILDRLIAEHMELSDKLQKLESFITSETFSTINEQNQDLLIEQCEAMHWYSEILENRIALNS